MTTTVDATVRGVVSGDDTVTLYHGDSLDILATLPDASVDAIVTDPPYGLEFMGKDWDRPWKASSVGRGVRVEAERASEMTEPGKGHSTSAGPYLAARVGSVRVAGLPFQQWCTVWATECLRVLKPGGHLLAFGGTRTWHRLAAAVEDAGFEIRDSIAWLYGSGFPKSLDVSKAIDKRPGVSQHPAFAAHLAERRQAAGLSRADVSEAVVGTRTGACWNWEHHQFPEAKWWPALRDLLDLDEQTWGPVIAEAERQKIGVKAGSRLAVAPGQGEDRSAIDLDVTTHATGAAEQWQGWGTALKPAFEPIVVARKPLAGTVAANVLEHGTGALNIDGCRVGRDGRDVAQVPAGRWPTNVVLDDSQAAVLDEQSGESASRVGKPRGAANGEGWGMTATGAEYDDQGGASRFFPTFRYEAKAPSSERPFYYRPTCECEDAWPTHTPSTVRATDGTTAPASSSTSKSGSATTGDLSPTATRSTTSTATSSITTPTTSSPSPRPTTSASTPDANSETATGGSRAAFAASSSPLAPVTGTSAVRGGRSTDDAARATSQGLSATSVCGECGAPTRREAHATVKPLDLMRWLIRLVTPPGGTILDPFAGSGTTVEACLIEGFNVIAIERETDYLPLIEARIARRTNATRALELAGEDMGLLGLIDGEAVS